jgi:hypothetical protein
LPPRYLFAIGLLAGVGLALKPYFLLIPLGIELYLAYTRRDLRVWLRPETLVIGAVLALYGLSVVVLTPDYFNIARMALQVYQGFDASTTYLLLYPATALTALAVGAWGIVRRAISAAPPGPDRRRSATC